MGLNTILTEDNLLKLDVSFSLEQLDLINNMLSITPGEGVILDPFAGAGLAGIFFSVFGHQVINIENDPDHFEALKGNFEYMATNFVMSSPPIFIYGDSATVEFPEHTPNADYVITSPPFTISTTSRPFTEMDQYITYIQSLGDIFDRLKSHMSKNVKMLIEMGDDVFNGRLVTLADMLISELDRRGFQLLVDTKRLDTDVGARYLIFKLKQIES
jgi:predicted RNA methylase